jgi:hypothetical protein
MPDGFPQPPCEEAPSRAFVALPTRNLPPGSSPELQRKDEDDDDASHVFDSSDIVDELDTQHDQNDYQDDGSDGGDGEDREVEDAGSEDGDEEGQGRERGKEDDQTGWKTGSYCTQNESQNSGSQDSLVVSRKMAVTERH